MKTKKLGIILLTILVFSLMAFSCQPIVTEPVDNTTPPPPVEPVQGDKPSRAGTQFMNIMINGDEIQTKVKANYPSVASFYGDGGAMLEGLAVANLYPPREANPDFPFSLKNNMISYMPERDTLKNFQIQGTKPTQSELATYCATVDNRISTTSPDPASYQSAMDTARTSFNSKAGGDITDLGGALVDFGVTNALIPIFVEGASSILGALGAGGAALAQFIPGIGQVVAILAAASLVNSVINWLGDILNPNQTEIENAIVDLYNKMAAMESRLNDLEVEVYNLDLRFQATNATNLTQNFGLVRNQLNTWRGELTQKMNLYQQYHSPSDLTAFITSATAIDTDITSLINNYIELAISSHDAYLTYLSSAGSLSGSYATDKTLYLGKQSLGMKVYVNETVNKKVYNNGALTGNDNSVTRSGWFQFTNYADALNNPNRYLPFSNEVMDFLYEIILFRMSLVNIIHERPVSQEAQRSFYAKNLLNTPNQYIQKIRQELNTGYTNMKTEMDSLSATIDTFSTNCQTKMTHDLWQGPSVAWQVTYGDQFVGGGPDPDILQKAYATYNWNAYAINSLTYQNYTGANKTQTTNSIHFTTVVAGETASFPNTTTANILKTGIPEQTVTNINTAYTGKIVTGITRSLSTVQLTIGNNTTTLAINYSDADFWNKIKEMVKMVYMSRSSEMLNFAARLASLEMLLETYVCD